ncbi:MAG: NAD+ synthase [Candidatus Omnitrophota bacterium]
MMTKKRKQRIRVALAQINPVVGDLEANKSKISSFIQKAGQKGADIVAFGELALTGYPPEDLLMKKKFVDDNLSALKSVVGRVDDVVALVGFVDRKNDVLYNAASVMYRGKMRAVYHKHCLPNYGVFDEKRYFACGQKNQLFGIESTVFGVNICEDMWHQKAEKTLEGARLIVNINASPYHCGKVALRQRILKTQAKNANAFIVYVNLVGGQDELIFDGQSMVIDPRGRLVARAKGFVEELMILDLDLDVTSKKVPVCFKSMKKEKPLLEKREIFSFENETQEIYEALVLGLKDYIVKNGFKKVVLGLSGGIDSALVSVIASDAIGAENVLGVFMPSVYSSDESFQDARSLADNLGIQFKIVAIQDIFEQYLKTLEGIFENRKPDITEENLQARIRGNIIMALSNKFGYLALNTGNKSEVSCGYCTLYGDMAGGFGVLKDVFKGLVYELAAYRNHLAERNLIPERIFSKAPTAELRPGQKDSDTLPPYPLLDKILKSYVEQDKSLQEIVRSGIDEDLARRVIRLVDHNEYKRRQAPAGIKITPKAFGKDRRMPITNGYR